MTYLVSFIPLGVVWATAFAVFVGARLSVTRICGLGPRLPVFGEVPLSRLDEATAPVRWAVALAGLVAVYSMVALVCSVAYSMAGDSEGTTVVNVLYRPGSAAAAGIQPDDRIVAVGGVPVSRLADLRSALDRQPEGDVEVRFERQGHQRRVNVVLDATKRLGIQTQTSSVPIGLGTALRRGLAAPILVNVDQARLTAQDWRQLRTLTGPVGITQRSEDRLKDTVTRYLAVLARRLCIDGLPLLVIGALALFPFSRRRATSDGDAAAAQAGAAAATAAASGGAGTPLTGPRPWLRFAARAVDWSLLAWAMTLLQEVVPPLRFVPIGALIPLAWLPFEAVLLAHGGRSPGKWLLGITVTGAAGRPLRFHEALHREGLIWVYGFGAGLPIGLATGIVAHHRLKRSGSAYWDELCASQVRHGPVQIGRALVAGFAITLGVALTLAFLRHALIR